MEIQRSERSFRVGIVKESPMAQGTEGLVFCVIIY